MSTRERRAQLEALHAALQQPALPPPVDEELESLQRALAELNARASALQARHDALEGELLMVRVETPRVSTPVEQLQPWMTRGWSLLLMVSLLLLAVFLGQC